MFVAEGHDRRAHGRVRFVGEKLEDPDPELVDVQLAGVHHHVGPVADGLEEAALVDDGLLHVGPGDGVAPAGPLEAPDQDVLGGVEIDDPDPVAPAPQLVDGPEGFLDLAAAPPDDQGHPVLARSGPAHHVGHLGEERRRHVVDHVPAGVLQGRRRRRPAGTGEAGDEDIVGRSRGGLFVGGNETNLMAADRALTWNEETLPSEPSGR